MQIQKSTRNKTNHKNHKYSRIYTKELYSLLCYIWQMNNHLLAEHYLPLEPTNKKSQVIENLTLAEIDS